MTGTRAPQSFRHPLGLLWDMDGTLIDTEPYWMEAETELVESYGKTWSEEQAFLLVGNELTVSASIIIEQTGIPLTPPEVVERLLVGVIARLKQHVPWRPGAKELLLEAREAGRPCALVTMSYESFARVLIESLPAGTFEVVVTGDKVTYGKPHPEPYRRAAHELGLAPEHCIAFEDSPTGVRSATAAEVPTVAIEHLVKIPDLPGLVKVQTLRGVLLNDLGTLMDAACATRARVAQ